MIDAEACEHLRAAIDTAEAVLFTGAGFSADACDAAGRALPLARAMADELRALCFGDADDDSTLQDLYDVASRHHADRLAAYLRDRLRVGDSPLPDHYGLWFAAPWARVYTLNVDDLELAVARQFELPRAPRPISALAPDRPIAIEAARPRRDALEVVHLNGIVGDDLDAVTFSTLQHATRLVTPCPFYAALIADLAARPFVFIGTGLDEALFWQHLQLGRRDLDGNRPASLLVTPTLSRARRALLEDLRIEWIAGTAAELAELVLAPIVPRPIRRTPPDRGGPCAPERVPA